MVVYMKENFLIDKSINFAAKKEKMKKERRASRMEWVNPILQIKKRFLHVISNKLSGNAAQPEDGANICSEGRALSARKNEHSLIVYLLFAVQVILTISCGRAVIPVVGIVLCAVGFIKGKTKVDLWIFVPMILYNVFTCAASYVSHGNIRMGAAYAQLIFPILYLVLSYLDDGDLRLLRRLCIIWVAFTALFGLAQFFNRVLVHHSVMRLRGIVGGPNAVGPFLVIGYFVYLGCMPKEANRTNRIGLWFWKSIEPVMLTTLALTLSMGSFVALSVGMIAIFVAMMRRDGLKASVWYICRLGARVCIGLAFGLLLYISVGRTGKLWLCIPMAVYIAIFTLYWDKFDRFLLDHKRMAVLIAASGILLALMAVIIRPSSTATFLERLQMMRNGIHYIAANPLFGVGQGNWQGLNMYDADKYFNVSHIHNMFIHTGAETGVAAMLMLLVITIRCFIKKKELFSRASCSAFLFHSMIDTAFFITKIPVLLLITAFEPRSGAKTVKTAVVRALCGVLAVVFVCNLYGYLTTG